MADPEPRWNLIVPSVHRLELPWQIFGMYVPVNVYLVSDASGTHFSLIDTGLAEHAPTLIPLLHEKIGNGSLDFVLITHGHLDHAGGLRFVMEAFPSCTAVIQKAERPFICDRKLFREIRGESMCSPFSCFKSCLKELALNVRPTESLVCVISRL